jgi:hypothetical protein
MFYGHMKNLPLVLGIQTDLVATKVYDYCYHRRGRCDEVKSRLDASPWNYYSTQLTRSYVTLYKRDQITISLT